jgi:uncharacterized protein YciI
MRSQTTLPAVLAASLLLGTILLAQDKTAPTDKEKKPMNKPPVYQVLCHSPGASWKKGVPFREQPGVQDHVKYMAGFLEKGTLVVGGPFLDDSGGMMVMNASEADAKAAAEGDPAVKAGLLKVVVRPWLVAMANVELPEAKAAK